MHVIFCFGLLMLFEILTAHHHHQKSVITMVDSHILCYFVLFVAYTILLVLILILNKPKKPRNL